ncbi:hypothetical protein Ami103574_10875 [Aminipila butyrica]|uniref:Uncharacterized protein n=1 Tax=Aminipila butyrica TaxID=433296 RepID=A0A858BWJ1_9FIRM|nr:hypothetical protein [Aminipila butyrica]QIB69792.1 hypothetical protein Ami103574_10875 [Aminipila butyrica]
MRKVIIYASIILVLIFAATFRSDYVQVELLEQQLKNDLQSAGAGSAMLLDKEKYADGFVAFQDEEVCAYVRDILAGYDWYKVHIWDDKNIYRIYDQDGLISQEAATYPYVFMDNKNMKTQIDEPTIILEGQAKGEFYRLTDLQDQKNIIQRTTKYVVGERRIKE